MSSKTCHICGAYIRSVACMSCGHEACSECPEYVEKPSYNELETQIKEKDRKFEEHIKAVGQFLSDMYATMVDPLEEHGLKVKELCDLLLKRATEDREKIKDLADITYKCKDDPEANGRTPQKGEQRFTLTFPLENGDSLKLHMGKEGMNEFANFIGNMISDDAAEAEDREEQG